MINLYTPFRNEPTDQLVEAGTKMTTNPQAFADESFCYLTTTGRVTGRPHTIEIWFALEGHTLYMLAGGGDSSDWVKNLLRSRDVTVRIGDTTYAGLARIVE